MNYSINYPMKMTDNKNKVVSDNHRIKNFWDVTYDESVDINNFAGALIYEIGALSLNHKQFQSYVIDFSHEKQEPVEATLDSVKQKAERIYIEDIQFNTCDFIGGNEGKKITFRNCVFEKAYFGYSCLRDVNFENCKFLNTSFALTKFHRCRFDELCSFSNISISGSKTVFTESVISAGKFIDAIYIYATKDYCKKNPTKKLDQERSKMYESMVKLARNILESVSKNGDDDSYYNAVKQVHKLKIKEKHHKKLWEIKKNTSKSFLKKCFSTFCYAGVKCIMPIETFILKTFGFLNGWGASVFRCVLFGFSILSAFSILYYFFGMESVHSEDATFPHVIKSIIQSFDITFLAGYTKYVSAKDDYIFQLMCLANMLLGLIWYAISIPTVINKISINRI